MAISRLYVGSSSESLHLAQALKSCLESAAEVRVWNEDLFRTGNSTLEDLLRLVNNFDYAAFVLSSDDALVSRGQSYLTPRDNVVLEAGMFYGVLGRERVFLLLPGMTAPRVPSDLAGIHHLFFREPSDKNYRAELGTPARIMQERIGILGPRQARLSLESQVEADARTVTVFDNAREARSVMKADCQQAETIAIIRNRGLGAFGTDQSLVSLAELNRYNKLRKVRILLLSEDSRWLSQGFVQLRTYESIDALKKELRASAYLH